MAGDALHPWYVTGLAEGQAAFSFSRARQNFTLYFAVKLTASERPILLALQRHFAGAGRLYDVRPSAPRSPRQGYTKAAVYYRITRLEELDRVVRHFTAYPLSGNRGNAFTVWREMVELKRQNFRRPPLARLDELARALSAASPRNQAWDGP